MSTTLVFNYNGTVATATKKCTQENSTNVCITCDNFPKCKQNRFGQRAKIGMKYTKLSNFMCFSFHSMENSREKEYKFNFLILLVYFPWYREEDQILFVG